MKLGKWHIIINILKHKINNILIENGESHSFLVIIFCFLLTKFYFGGKIIMLITTLKVCSVVNFTLTGKTNRRLRVGLFKEINEFQHWSCPLVKQLLFLC